MEKLEGLDLEECPFCGGKLGATLDKNGRPDGLVHEIPFCEKFDKLDVIEFITAVRKELEQKGSN